MDFTTLKFFQRVANEKSFSKAASSLNYAQSNLSTRISQFEKELQTPLFVRSSSGVQLTAKGEVLLKYADTILNLAGEAEKAIRDDGTAKGKLVIGSMESSATTFLPRLLSDYHRENPEVQLTVETGTSQESVRRLLDHKIDGAFIAGEVEHPDLCRRFIAHEQLVLITSSALAPEDFEETLLRQPLLVFPQGCSYRKVLESWLEYTHIMPERIVEFDSLGGIISSVSAGLGISLFPLDAVKSYSASGALKYYPLPDHIANVPTVFIYRKDSYMPLSLQYFIRALSYISLDGAAAGN